MSELNNDLVPALHEVRDAARVLAEEIGAYRRATEAAVRALRRLTIAFFAILFGVPALSCGSIWLCLQFYPRGENGAERAYREERERQERKERILDRAEKLADKWEKAAPR